MKQPDEPVVTAGAVQPPTPSPAGNQVEPAEALAAVAPSSESSSSPASSSIKESPGRVDSSQGQRIKAIDPKPSKATLATVSAPVKLIPGERSYLQTIARLDSTIKSNQKEMRPSLRAEYERNLAVVDRAIAATRTAAKSNPNNPDAADFMFAAYQSKVDLLNTIADARLGGRRY
jgi:hypothetical protein